jgi:multiple sugar transport system substrate-binding protein
MRKLNKVAKLAAISAAVAVVLAGCSSSSEEAATDTGAAAGAASGTVRVLMEGVPDTDIVSGLLADFNAEYPDVKVEIETASYDQMRDKYVASFTAAEPSYDLAILDNPWVGDFAKAGFVQPLDDLIAATDGYDYADFTAPLRAIGESDGKVYGVPFYNYALGLIYRSDLVTAEPASLDELAATAKSLTTADRAGIAMQPQKGYKAFEEWGNYLFAAGGSLYTDGKVKLTTPEAKKALETYIAMYKSSAPKDSLNWGFDDALRSVSSDKSAMMVSYNWMLPTLNNPDGDSGALAGKFKLATMPGGKQVLGSWHWAIPTNSKASEAAWAFVSWISSKAGEAKRVTAGGAPTRTSVFSDAGATAKDPAYFATIAKILSNAEPLCQGANCDEMINAVGTELNAAFAGEKSVDDALAAAEEQANKIQAE